MALETVIDPQVLIEEIEQLKALNVTVDNLYISQTAHITMPYHRKIDRASEESRGDYKIGTTGRGIGPTYADKSERTGIRVYRPNEPRTSTQTAWLDDRI